MLSQQEPMMGRHAAAQRLAEFRAGRLHARACQGRQGRSVRLARDERVQNPPPTRPHHIGQDAGELEVGILQHLLDPLHVLAQRADELFASPGQIPQLLHRGRRHEATPQQPVREEVGQPHRVVHVALAARHVPHVPGVGQHQLEAVREYVPDRLPVHPRRLHRDVRAAVRAEPVAHLEKPRRRRPERADFALDASARHDPRAGDHRLLVHVQSYTPGIEHAHRGLPFLRPSA